MRKEFIGLALAALAAQSAAVELVTNGSFEATPNNAGWATSTFTLIEDWSFNVPVPTHSVWMGGYSNAFDTLTQLIDFGAAPGTATLTFDLGFEPVDFPFVDLLFISLGGFVLETIDIGDELANPRFVGPNLRSYDVSGFMGTGTQWLAFDVVTDQSFDSSAYLDNISINAAPVPEPATLVSLSLGTLMLAAARRLRMRRPLGRRPLRSPAAAAESPGTDGVFAVRTAFQ